MREPCRRGDHDVVAVPVRSVVGQPPQTRGSLVGPGGPALESGTTPAGAGITPVPGGRHRMARDHPRRRGDHSQPRQEQGAGRGPPPQARGSHPLVDLFYVDTGTTPAGAGITTSPIGSSPARRDHPRRRGNHTVSPFFVCPFSGPPPQARGSLLHSRCRVGDTGTTPAGAGITASSDMTSSSLGDHPRRRGDHGWAVKIDGTAEGPPPQARGSQQGSAGALEGGGTTPAGAGITHPKGLGRWRGGDHPRRRGDHSS